MSPPRADAPPASRFVELSLPCASAAAQERWWTDLFDAQVLFRGTVLGHPYCTLRVAGVNLVFREDPDFEPPPGPGHERHYRFHVGLRVADLAASIAALQAKGAQFTLTPEMVKAFQTPGAPSPVQTSYIAPPLTRARIDAGEWRHQVAFLVAPDNLWVELNEVEAPEDAPWYGPAP